MPFYRYGNMVLFIVVLLLFFGTSWHVYVWSNFFSKHVVYAGLIIIGNALVLLVLTKKINHFIREKTLNNILNDMNSHLNPEMALRKYESCIVDWKRIKTPVRIIYRLSLNDPLKIWSYHLAEEIGYDKLSKSWKLLRESGTWELHTGAEVPDDVPVGECRQCKNQIYSDDLEELDDKEMGLVCSECGSSDLDFGKT